MATPKQSEMVTGILVTQDPSIFRKLEGNRPVDERHVHRLMKSMKRRDLFIPMAVNTDMEVVDGQHRLEARTRLGIRIPYYIIPNEGDGGYGLEEVQTMNAEQKKWSVEDYTQSFIALGNGNYKVYKWFREKYGLPHNESIALLTGMRGRDNNRWSVIFNNGGLKVTHLEEAKARAEMIFETAPYFEHFQHRSYVQSILKLVDDERFEWKRFLRKLELQPTALKRCATMVQYVELIENIYNHQQREKVSFKYG